MNLKIKQLLLLVGTMVIGLLLYLYIPMLYFVGFILSFIMIMGENQLNLRQNETGQVNQPFNRHTLFYAIGGYIIAGIVILLIR